MNLFAQIVITLATGTEQLNVSSKPARLIITVVRSTQRCLIVLSCLSFFELKDGKISALDEYWADDGAAPMETGDGHRQDDL